jgi:low temperature requirement protein LtrA
MSKKTWWRPPRRFEDKQNERKISWLELFYDLVYVACIGQITSHIATHTDGKDIGYAVIFFVFVYWSWINGTQYYELHGNDTIRTRWFVFLQMLAVGAVAISAPEAFRGNVFSFTVSFPLSYRVLSSTCSAAFRFMTGRISSLAVRSCYVMVLHLPSFSFHFFVRQQQYCLCTYWRS